jgi:hypothetical protein
MDTRLLQNASLTKLVLRRVSWPNREPSAVFDPARLRMGVASVHLGSAGLIPAPAIPLRPNVVLKTQILASLDKRPIASTLNPHLRAR